VQLLDYGFGLNPRQGVGQLPPWQKSGGNFVANFSESGGVSGMAYGAQWSTTLADGSWKDIVDPGPAPVHTFTLPIAGKTRLFWRFVVGEDPNYVPDPLAGAVATQSSGYSGDLYPASNALDGNLTNSTHTDSGDTAPKWTVTLRFNIPISEVVLYDRAGGWKERLRNITVRVFSDAAGTVPVFTSALLNPGNVLNGPATLSVNTGAVSARVIRVSRGPSTPASADDGVLTPGKVQLTNP